MSRHPDFVPQGVIPAVLLPFHEDLSIDEPSFRAHLRDVGAVQGLSAITINAHSTEVASCTQDEQLRVMEITGKDPLPYGIEPNRRMLEEVATSALEQKIITRPVTVEDLFPKNTHALVG